MFCDAVRNRPPPQPCLLYRLNQSSSSKWKEQLGKAIFLEEKGAGLELQEDWIFISRVSSDAVVRPRREMPDMDSSKLQHGDHSDLSGLYSDGGACHLRCSPLE
jgi:hypothetical protein